jgi:hypothetical protein
MPLYTAEQRAAFSFVALERGGADWRHGINRQRLSFTDPGWDPATQLFGSLGACLAKLHIAPGDSAGLGFAAHTNPDGTVNAQDAERLRRQFVIFLTPEDGT